jgi:membrane protein implicated in regulation of membrane protease activity
VIFAWLAVGILLLFFEMHHLAFYALFGAVGAFAAAIVAGFVPGAIALQGGVAVGVSAVGVSAVRPYVSRTFHTHRGGKVAHGVHGGLVGEEAFTLDVVGDVRTAGHVRLAGERWLAVTETGQIPAGQKVLVLDVRGTTLVVYPSDGGLPEIGPPASGSSNTDISDHNTGAGGAEDRSTQ